MQELERSTPAPKAEKAAPKAQQAAQAAPTAADSPAPKLSYAEQRERDKALRRAAKKVEEAEANVTAREKAVADVEAEIAVGCVDPEIFTRHADATKELENAMSLWELAQMELDELKERYKQ